MLRTRQALSRSYGRFFAEFLGDLSFVRLALLELTTCVGLRYGFVAFSAKGGLEVFLGRQLFRIYPPCGEHFRSSFDSPLKADFRIFLETVFEARTSNPIMCPKYLSSSLRRNAPKSWNINHVSIRFGFRHPLRPD